MRSIQLLLMAAAVYVLLPFLYIAKYNYPSADDYAYAVRFSQHSLGDVLKTNYFEWSGRYVMPIVYRINPTCFHSLGAYRLFSLCMILLFVVTTILVIRSITREYLTLLQVLGLSALFICLYFSKTPGVSEAFYWFSSYSIYQTGNVLMLMLLMALIKLRKRATTSLLLWSCLLCVLIIGCNEIALIITVIFIHVYAITQYIKNRRLIPHLTVLCVVCLIAAAVEIAAPGNFTRLSSHPKTFGSIFWTITGSLSITGIYSSQWVLPLLVASLLYIPVFGVPIAQKMADENRSFDLSIRSFCWFFAGTFCFLLLFIVGAAEGSDLGRILDVVYFFVLLGYFFLLQLIVNKCIRWIKEADRYLTRVGMFGAALFFASLADINNNSTTAYVDLLSGKAGAYATALTDRAKRVSECRTDTCYVPALAEVPSTIFFTDIRPRTDSAGWWINYYYATYLHAGYVETNAAPPNPGSNLEALRTIGKSLRRRILEKKAK